MSTNKRGLIASMTPEDRKKQAEFTSQISDAEVEAVQTILAEGATPTALFKIIDNAEGFAEYVTSERRHPDTPQVACREGCDWCCYQTVPVTVPEAIRIAQFLSSIEHLETRTGIEARLHALDNKTRGLTPSKRAELRLPFAFLQDHRCTIYQVRPLACSEFTSFDVEDCKRGYEHGFRDGSVIHEKARMVVFYAVQHGLLMGLRRSLPTCDISYLELIAAVVCAMKAPRSAEQWLRGEPVFAEAHIHDDLK